ncbi:MAG: response regulator, partial [Magnetospirillum sp.]
KACISQGASSKPEVLFVDDERSVLDGIRRALVEKAVDWEMAFFDDPRAVLDAPQALSCKVIVTDLRMPDMNGLDLLEQLRARGMSAEAIILTGTGDMASALEAINTLRVFRYYTKPCPSSRLIEGIADAIRHRDGASVPTVVADRLPLGILALDGVKRIGFMNKEGAKLVAAGTVLFADAAGRCRASTPQQTALLHRSIDKVLKEGESAVIAMTDVGGERRYSCLIDLDGRDRSDSVLLFVRDIDRYPVPSVDTLKRLFDFSGSEAKLAYELAAGFDIKDAAERVNISVLTARTYLKTLFGKTRTNRQAELVRLLVTAMPSMLSDGNDTPSDHS